MGEKRTWELAARDALGGEELRPVAAVCHRRKVTTDAGLINSVSHLSKCYFQGIQV